MRDKGANKYVSLFSYASNGTLINHGDSFIIKPNMAPDYISKFFKAKENTDYEIELSVYDECTSASIQYSFYPSPPLKVLTNIPTGGLRVSTSMDFSFDKPNPIIKKYFYANKEDLSKSSGIIGQKPYYIDFTRTRELVEPSLPNPYLIVDETKYLNLSSSSISSLYDTGNSNIYYQFVTVSFGGINFEKGGEEHEFIVNRDLPGNTIWGDYNIVSAPFTNFGWDNGAEKTVIYFNKNKLPIKKVSNTYEENEAARREVISYSSRKLYEPIIDGPATYTCTLPDLTKTFSYSHAQNNSFWKTYDTTIVQQHSCFGLTVGTTVAYPSNVGNISVMQYKNISYWHYLKSTEELLYDINGLNPTTIITDYNYNSSHHLQLTSQITTNSKGDIQKTEYKYSPDLIGVEQTPYMQQLTDANRISDPVITSVYSGNTKLSERHTRYNNSAITGTLLLPTEIHFNKGSSSINIADGKDRKITYNRYDDKGNILQYTPESGIPVSIIWGYGQTQPIAKIENASYSDISSYVSNLQNVSDSGTQADLIVALNTLRAALPNAMVTTYTYIPLVGVSTITDAKGDRMTYTYDSFGRLEFVKDKEGNILSENQYHYKN